MEIPHAYHWRARSFTSMCAAVHTPLRHSARQHDEFTSDPIKITWMKCIMKTNKMSRYLFGVPYICLCLCTHSFVGVRPAAAAHTHNIEGVVAIVTDELNNEKSTAQVEICVASTVAFVQCSVIHWQFQTLATQRQRRQLQTVFSFLLFSVSFDKSLRSAKCARSKSSFDR